MGNKLYSEEAVQAIAAAIRAKDGDAADMTVAQMPARIGALVPEVWRECWLEKPLDAPTALGVDTGIASAFTHHLKVKCRTTIGRMSAPFVAAESSGNRFGMNFLPNGNKVQVYWGTYSNTNIAPDRTQYDLTNILEYSMHQKSVSINCYNSNGIAATYALDYTGVNGSGTPTYKLFIYPRNADINKGIFRRAVIYTYQEDGSNVPPLYTIVPEVSSTFAARLKITDHMAGTERYVPVPAGFICHVDNEAAA